MEQGDKTSQNKYSVPSDKDYFNLKGNVDTLVCLAFRLGLRNISKLESFNAAVLG